MPQNSGVPLGNEVVQHAGAARPDRPGPAGALPRPGSVLLVLVHAARSSRSPGGSGRRTPTAATDRRSAGRRAGRTLRKGRSSGCATGRSDPRRTGRPARASRRRTRRGCWRWPARSCCRRTARRRRPARSPGPGWIGVSTCREPQVTAGSEADLVQGGGRRPPDSARRGVCQAAADPGDRVRPRREERIELARRQQRAPDRGARPAARTRAVRHAANAPASTLSGVHPAVPGHQPVAQLPAARRCPVSSRAISGETKRQSQHPCVRTPARAPSAAERRSAGPGAARAKSTPNSAVSPSRRSLAFTTGGDRPAWAWPRTPPVVTRAPRPAPAPGGIGRRAAAPARRPGCSTAPEESPVSTELTGSTQCAKAAATSSTVFERSSGSSAPNPRSKSTRAGTRRLSALVDDRPAGRLDDLDRHGIRAAYQDGLGVCRHRLPALRRRA